MAEELTKWVVTLTSYYGCYEAGDEPSFSVAGVYDTEEEAEKEAKKLDYGKDCPQVHEVKYGKRTSTETN